MWLLSELFEVLPEAGDLERPKLVLFFDEAHLLFDQASKPLLEKVEQVVRLIRSKGVGVYFITQSPSDLPDSVLAQLGNRVQHALRAFTPKDQKAVRVAAQTFRPNPKFSAEQAITELEVGEALVSTLGDKGIPNVVERTRVRPPCSRLGPASATERATVMAASPLAGRYDVAIDRISAYEHLKERAAAVATPAPATAAPSRPTAPTSQRRAPREPESIAGTLVKTAARSLGSQLGREVVRGILGSLLRRR
ncbi:putative ATPase (fragment) [uncultured Defluviicoccus sp.]|uniref:Putative ATPase n=1 Tax=metagenome TaxID=256318 RepID=A0A380TK93_9ZZZZ